MGRKYNKPKTAPRASATPTDPPTSPDAAPIPDAVAVIKQSHEQKKDRNLFLGYRENPRNAILNKFLSDFHKDPLPFSMVLLRGVMLELNRIEGMIELQRDGAARARLQTYAEGLREYKDDIAFDLVKRGETTKQALEERYKQWLGVIEPFTHSEDYRNVTIRGATHALTSRQAQMIEILHGAYGGGNPEVGVGYILEQLETENSRWQDTFRNNRKAKQDLIRVGASKGTLRLNL